MSESADFTDFNGPRAGGYKIQNVFYSTQYADLARGSPIVGTPITGYHDDTSVEGQQNCTFMISYTGGTNDLVTFMNPKSQSYATANALKKKLEGNGNPEVFKLIESPSSRGEYIICMENSDYVWYLDSNEDSTQIRLAASPSETDKRQFWKFM
ncbi:hypothetical protein DEU56DRAFT_756667 [Suillus clintonianus]|uniref:uncharacterized protein n=1 Tax=Suillus clintonianus TaxID=1904413 RepID=UPI001B86CA7E|nr:uncharacterized protein DEU56DRAFT_756667 [Suillus clintonianus]KAG2135267.1 hypothetical protein DEU56DRAFT_756667 [Suillus clintonianus]